MWSRREYTVSKAVSQDSSPDLSSYTLPTTWGREQEREREREGVKKETNVQTLLTCCWLVKCLYLDQSSNN